MLNNKQTKMVAVGSVLFLVLLFTSLYFMRSGGGSPEANLPQTFLLSRKTAALISQNIVDLTNKTGEKISSANTADLAGDRARASSLILEAQNTNVEASRATSQLAGQLKVLTESLATMSSVSSQRLAYEAVATELALVSEFVVYTQNLNEFLEKLLVSMETDTKVSKADIASSLTATNKSARKINSLNAEFSDRMAKLDKSF